MTEQLSQPKIAYRLGKITNKYLILEIYEKAYHTIDVILYRMFYNDKTSRDLLIKNFKKIKERNHHRL
jgi:hypothetical protein